MNNEELINFVSEGIVQKVQQALENSQVGDDDGNIPPLMEGPKPTVEILFALTVKIDTFGQALATLQQKTPIMPQPQNPYCNFIPQHPGPYGYAPYPPPPPPPRMTSIGTTPRKPARWKFFGQYCHSCGACDHWGSKCLWENSGHINKATFKDRKDFIAVKLDSGASKHYFRSCDAIALKNIQHVKNGSSITLPDGDNIKIQHKGHVPLHPSIDTRAGEVNIVPHLHSASLLSVGQFTNFECTAELSYNKTIIKESPTTYHSWHKKLPQWSLGCTFAYP